MRIISGKYRGRKLNSPKNQDVRPTVDRVKESVFNVLQFKVVGAVVLDLFAGSGSYGIECLSRSCNKVVFNDNSKESLDLLKSNLRGIEGNFEIMSSDCISALGEFKRNKQGFDLIFLDPPFHSDLSQRCLEFIYKNSEILNEDAIIVCEHLTSQTNLGGEFFNIKKEKSYGLTTVTYFELKENL